MDRPEVILGYTDDVDYDLVGKLADGTVIYKFNEERYKHRLASEKQQLLNEKRRKIASQEKTIQEYNEIVDPDDTETAHLLERLKQEELSDQEHEQLLARIKEKYSDITPEQKPTGSRYDTPILTPKNDQTDIYLEKFQKEEAKKERPAPVQKPVTAPPKVKKKTSKSKYDIEPAGKTDQYIQNLPTEPEVVVPEQTPTPKQPPKYTSKSLVESYHEAKDRGEIIEQELVEEHQKSIADFYDKLKPRDESESEHREEVLDYYEDSDDPVEESDDIHTSEYLDLFHNKEKLRQEKDARKKALIDKHKETLEANLPQEESAQPVMESKVEEEEIDTNAYLELFQTQESKDEIVEGRALQIEQQKEEDKRVEESEKVESTKAVEEKVDEYKDEQIAKLEEVQEDLKVKKGELSKEYYKHLLEQKHADDPEYVEREYTKIKEDFAQRIVDKRTAAMEYLELRSKLDEEQTKALLEYEKQITDQQQRINETYHGQMVWQDTNIGEDHDISEEFGQYQMDITIANRTVSVTDKDTGVTQTFGYQGTLSTYNIAGYRLQLQAVNKDQTQFLRTPNLPQQRSETMSNWFIANQYMTFDLRDGSAIDEETYHTVKMDIDRDVGGEDQLADDELPLPRPGTFAITGGWGFSDCTELFDFSEIHAPNSPTHTIAPDGIFQGFVKLAVARLGGTDGAVTVRALIKPALPSFAAENDYTIDWDPVDYPEREQAVGTQYFGGGAYNYCSEAIDSEVAMVSSTSLTYNTDPNSDTIQTLTWDDGEAGAKHLVLRHCTTADPDNIAPSATRTGNTWYGVYLTFDQTHKMGVYADGVTSPTTRVPTACASIAPTDQFPEFIGSELHPFYVAISGYGGYDLSDIPCTDSPLY